MESKSLAITILTNTGKAGEVEMLRPDPDIRVILVDHVASGWYLTRPRIFIVAGDKSVFMINDEVALKQGDYFAEKFGDKSSSGSGELLKLRGHGKCRYEDGWEIV